MKRRNFCRAALGTAAIAGLNSGYFINGAFAGSAIPAVTGDGAEISLEAASVRELAGAIEGQVLLAADPQYDVARRVWNGMHDRRPALIARVSNSRDVQHAVDYAAERKLLLAVRGGGHSWPGKSVCDGGLMIDLNGMHRVTVDSQRRRASAEGGALLSHLDTASLEHGLVTTAGVVSHTGIGGFTLGGGFGRLNRKYGLTVDNLLAAELVTADGRIRRVSAMDEPELFWAIRGGGGNFGVVTEFEYQLHPFDRKVLSGNILWPLDQAREVLEFYAEWSAGLSDELYVGPSLARMPDVGDAIIMEVVYNGDPVQGEKELAPLRAIGKPAIDGVKVQDYMVMQTQEDAAMAHGVRSYAKNGMVKTWSQGLVDTMIDAYDPRVFLTNHVAGGAVKRVGETATAFPHRNAELMLVFVAGWAEPAMDQEMIAATRAQYAALEPYMGGYYDNIEYDRDAKTRNFGPAYARLARAKSQYDPGNLFRLNSNIEPG
ncbi:FAD-binding protein [Seongchinamella sediminis]|uniref:FAD-binding protein n=1 Tax=Seongchinamella sediminis TaxID=2283635 RepID=A0A3L7DW74_9GAMM|nr:FAD-binding oxidoreductase [Seongchinamella sediminis]RLQ20483.1 FAD-binding protein [Seongchinamella sediminis]